MRYADLAMSAGRGRPPRRPRAQAIVETALLIPIIVLLCLLLFDVVVMVRANTQCGSAAAEGARYLENYATQAMGTQNDWLYRSCIAATDHVEEYMDDDSDVTVTIDSHSVVTDVVNYTTQGIDPQTRKTTIYKVPITVSKTVQFAFPVIGITDSSGQVTVSRSVVAYISSDTSRATASGTSIVLA